MVNPPTAQDRVQVEIPVGRVSLQGDLAVPPGAAGLVIFAHGSGSGRFSPRNRFVAERVNAEGLGTLLMDLLTNDEEQIDERTGHLRFDIELLADRVCHAAEWATREPRAGGTRIGVFGASTGGGAALVAAARHPELVKAVVSRGGRPDLAGPHLERVQAPTLLIVGGRDYAVLEMNRSAAAQLSCEKALEIIPNATHLFEQPGALDEVARLAADWFKLHLAYAGEAGQP